MAIQKRKSKSSGWRLRAGERRAIVTLGDLFMAVLALIIAIYMWANAEAQPREFFEFIRERLQNWFFLLPFAWLILLADSYDARITIDKNKTLRAIALATGIGFVIYMAVYFGSEALLPRLGVAIFLAASAVLTMLWRLLYIRVFTAPRFMHRALLVGAGETGQALLEVFEDLWPPPYFLVGLIDDDVSKKGKKIMGYKVMGGSERLLEVIEDESITDLIVAISGLMMPRTFQTLLDAQERGVTITRMPVAYEELLSRVPVKHLEADWILRSFVDESRVGTFYSVAKRALDILGGLVGILILLFLGPLISALILLESGSPVIIEQTRAGKGGAPFKIFKFRTMVKDAEGEGEVKLTTENDQRVTPLGRFLRKTHLDEWLQFFNVLQGEMSMVGPRPERPEWVDHFQEKIPFYRARLLVKPGMAGWAQVHFNYAATVEEMVMKLEYDLYYIKHRSFWLDILILIRAMMTVIGLRGR
ncbi:MAG: sugar transferase [Anaerolineales bacterium]|jgi:exopolysaccharide biosynthesis polyprenyl glycosylphosphotransferase